MFPRVERPLGCPSGACRISTASSAQLCRTGCAVAIHPPCETCTRFRFMPGPDPLARPAVSLSPSTRPRAQQGRAGRRNHCRIPAPVATWRALLEAPRYGGNSVHVGDVDLSVWRTDVPLRACIRQLGGLRHAVSPPRDRRKAAWRRPPSLRVRARIARDLPLSFMDI